MQEDAKAKAPIEYIKTVDTYTYEVEIDSSEIAKGLLIEEAGGKVLFVKSLRKAVVLDGFFFWPFTYTIDAKFLWSVKPYKTVEVDR